MKSMKLASLLPSDDDNSIEYSNSFNKRSTRSSIQSNDSLRRLSSKSSSTNSSTSTSSSSSSSRQKKRMPIAIPNSPDELPDLNFTGGEVQEEEEHIISTDEDQDEPSKEEIDGDSSFVTCVGSIARPKALPKLANNQGDDEDEDEGDDTDVIDDEDEEHEDESDDSDEVRQTKKTAANRLSSSGDSVGSKESTQQRSRTNRRSTIPKGQIDNDDDDILDDAETRKELEKLRSKHFVVDSIDKSQNEEESIIYEFEDNTNKKKELSNKMEESSKRESIVVQDSDGDSDNGNENEEADNETEESSSEEMIKKTVAKNNKNMIVESESSSDDGEDDDGDEIEEQEASSINMKSKPRNIVRDETSDSSDKKSSSSSSVKTTSSSSLASSKSSKSSTDDSSHIVTKPTAAAKMNLLASSDEELADIVIDNLEQSFNKQMSLKQEIRPARPDVKSELKSELVKLEKAAAAVKKDEDSIIELDEEDDEEEIKDIKKPIKAETRFQNSPQAKRDETPVPAWSPNIDRLEALKNRIKTAELARQQQERKMMEMKPIDKLRSEPSSMLMSVANSSKFHNRNVSFEEQLKCLRENMLEVLESQPDPEKSYEGIRMPSGLNVKLLPHQLYSMKWLRWRENSYPNGSILADDMGLGKTLTILAYLKLQKDEKERLMREKEEDEGQKEEEEEEEEEEDELAALSKATRLRLKSSSSRKPSSAASRRYTPVERLKTLIVLPASLLYQWETEIQTKFASGTFKYHIYHGPNRKKSAYNLDDNDIVFTTYEVVSREIEIIDSKEDQVPRPTNPSSQSPLVRIKWKRIILDEAHRIKNHTTKMNKAVCLLDAKYRHAITGTPVHNKYTDFYSLLKFLRMAPLSDMHLWNYLFPKDVKQTQLHAQRELRMNSWLVLLSNYILLRRTKSDKLNSKSDRPIVDLPTKTIETVSFKLKPEENAIYKKIFKESSERVNKILLNQQRRAMGRNVKGGNQSAEIFVYLLRLRQACCHMSLLAECLDKEELQKIKLESDDIEGMMDAMTLNATQNSVNSSINSTASSASTDIELDAIRSDTDLAECLERNYTSSKSNKLIEMVEELLDSYPDDKMVIVSQWTSYLDIIGSMLRKRRIKYVQIRGDVSLYERNEIVKRFNQLSDDDDDGEGDGRIMLLSLTAGGVGLNLVGANRMFLLDIHWNPALEQQCSDRIYRVGQKKPVTIYRFLTQSTIEERILDVQKLKMSIAERVCSANTATGLTSTTNAKLTLNDFKTLFRDYDEEQSKI